MDEKADEEEARKESSEKDGKVGTELNLKGKTLGRERLDDGVSSKGWGDNDSWGNRDGGLEGGCVKERRGAEVRTQSGNTAHCVNDRFNLNLRIDRPQGKAHHDMFAITASIKDHQLMSPHRMKILHDPNKTLHQS